MIATTARAAYASNAISTASPAKLLVMLYDRLARDLVVARERLAERDVAGVHEQLMHAQQIVLELRSSLDVSAWDGAQGLADLYDFLLQELVAANVGKDDTRIAGCQEVVEPLREAWREAALSTLRSA
jgi:flagellar protein FliS